MEAARGWSLRFAAAALVFTASAVVGSRLYPYAMREGYRLCELVGIMDPGGALGGQVARFNFQREPGWAHWVVRGLAGVAAFGPGLALAFAAVTPGVIGRGPNICGACGRGFRDGAGGRCPRCGEVFS